LNFRMTSLRDGSVGTVTGYRLDDWGSILSRGKRFLSIAQRPDLLWSPPSLLPNGQGRRCIQLTTHLHLVLKSRLVELYLHSPICLHVVVLNQAQWNLYLFTYTWLLVYSYLTEDIMILHWTDWIQLAHDRNENCAFMRNVMNLQAPVYCVTSNISRKTTGRVFWYTFIPNILGRWRAPFSLPQYWFRFNIVMCICDYRRGLDWRPNLLHTYKTYYYTNH
jgi:hypothetical protein